ncbi:MAG: hypothetical protein KGI82_00170 [Betaproteobacteria bacterium]|nr:hypothetical protein [Betaproteobacteria bacterium]MDE1988860.1 hypothetical protein [Betaproteobacteria bacterium]
MKRSLRHVCAVLLSLLLAFPAMATVPHGVSQMPCLHMQAMAYAAEKASMAGMSGQAGMAQEKQQPSGGHGTMEQYCAFCYVSVTSAVVRVVQPQLYGGQQLIAPLQSLNPSAVPDGAWRPPRTL